MPPIVATVEVDRPARVDFTGHGVGKLLVPLVVRREAAKGMPANLARLENRLEQRTS